MMYIDGVDVVFQEVPGEISLSIMVAGCSLRCRECHSAKSWTTKDKEEMDLKKFARTISKYENTATCILFFGGEWVKDFDLYLFTAKELYNFKTCLYTGLELNELKKNHKEILEQLDYVKTGRYIKELGGLDSQTTNQRFYKINKGWFTSNYKDITNKFKKREL